MAKKSRSQDERRRKSKKSRKSSGSANYLTDLLSNNFQRYEGEKVYFVGGRTPLTLLGPVFVIIFSIIALMIVNDKYNIISFYNIALSLEEANAKMFAAISVIYISILTMFTVYQGKKYFKVKLYITNMRIAVKEDYVENTAIKDVIGINIERPFLGKIFGFANLHITKDKGGIRVLPFLKKPQIMRKTIAKAMSKNKSKTRESTHSMFFPSISEETEKREKRRNKRRKERDERVSQGRNSRGPRRGVERNRYST